MRSTLMQRIRQSVYKLLGPFRSSQGGFNTPLIAVYAIVNGLVLINAALHHPDIGYDAFEHLRYIGTLSELRLPTSPDTFEYFGPPLPYAFPALIIALTSMPLVWAAKLGQLLNVALSLGLTYYLVRICHLLHPAPSFKLGTLFFLGLLPVYYKTFAFVRPEPYVAFFAVVMLYYAILIFVKRSIGPKNVVALGFTMGMVALSRQWGILLFPAIAVFAGLQSLKYRSYSRPFIKILFVSFILCFLLAGWFYLYHGLRPTDGEVTDSGLKRFWPGPSQDLGEPEVSMPGFSFRNQPQEFYFGLSPRLLFSRPVRSAFPNQLIPIFYSELWGDYWGYFVLYGKDILCRGGYILGWRIVEIMSSGPAPEWLETNWDTIVPYLGRVNLVSLFPSLLALAGTALALKLVITGTGAGKVVDPLQKESTLLLLLAIVSSIGGYLGFLIMFPNPGKGDLIKATYMLQTYPFISVLVGYTLQKIEARAKSAYLLVLGGLGLVFVHNLPVMLTRYSLVHLKLCIPGW